MERDKFNASLQVSISKQHTMKSASDVTLIMPGDEPSQGASMRMQLKCFILQFPHSLDHPVSKSYQLSEDFDTAKRMKHA
jgi:hypothetical protein